MQPALHSKFSIATNVCLVDAPLIRYTIPSWLRIWGDRLYEIVILVDEQPVSGRIAALHNIAGSKEQLFSVIDELMKTDSRIRYVVLNTEKAIQQISKKWFVGKVPLRCQAGTPIIAFLQAIEEATGDLVLRTDCDMLFHDDGWLNEADALLEQGIVDLVEPPKYGMHLHSEYTEVSSRAFLIRPALFKSSCLPLKTYRLDLFRRIHRRLSGRSSWLALEQIIQEEKKRKKIRHKVLDSQFGYSVHIYTREYAKLKHFYAIVSNIEMGRLPLDDQIVEWNLVLKRGFN